MLNNEQKKSLDDRIDGGLPTALPFEDRKSALLHLLRATEVRRNGVEQLRQRYGEAVAETSLDITREALHHCLGWIHQRVAKLSESDGLTVPRTTEADVDYCLSLLQVAADYSEISDVMTMLWLDRVEIKHHADDDIELAYSSEQIAFEAAQWLWRLNFKEVPPPRDALNDLQRWINGDKSFALDESLIFRIPHDVLAKMNHGMIKHSENLWQLPGVIDFESFSTNDFRQVWITLMTLAVIPRVVFNATNNVHVSIPVGTRESWLALISGVSGVQSERVRTIFDLLTYELDSTLKGTNKHKSESISQPIYQIDTNLFALSSMYVLISSAERNLFDLLSAKLPEVYDRRKDEKERQWAEHLVSQFKAHGFIALHQRKYSDGDIDVFVYDKSKKIGLVIQLKWLLLDRIKSRHLSEATKCIKQARDACRWISENPQSASSLLGLKLDDVIQGKFLPLAVLKEGLLNGFVSSPDVPLLSGNIFDSYLAKHGNDLQKLWNLAQERRFLPIKDYHYKIGDFAYIPEKPFNGVRFKRRRLSDRGQLF